VDVWLFSYYRDTRWDGPLMRADCVPTWDNESGLYALKEPDAPRLPCLHDHGDARVLGRVGLLGTVLEGEMGYRAEEQIVRELWLLDSDIYAGDTLRKVAMQAVTQALANRYQLTDEEVHVGWHRT